MASGFMKTTKPVTKGKVPVKTNALKQYGSEDAAKTAAKGVFKPFTKKAK